MSKKTEYKYDVAISLCKQDAEFARKLVKAINPGLNIFFYAEKQEELISKSGPEAFANIFKDQSRVVVILSRNEWSESYYTDIERSAIIDRTSVKNEGYNFLMVIPMEPGQIPSWYPSTRIYADPRNFPIDELAKFIEFKVTEQDGIVKPITLEDRYKNLLNRIEEKKNIIRLQTDKTAIEGALKGIATIKELFNQKIEILREPKLRETVSFLFTEHSPKAQFAIGDYMLECTINKPDELYHRLVTTQDISVSFQLYQHFGSGNQGKLLAEEYRLFYFSHELKGWALRYLGEQASEKELLVLFNDRNNRDYYDLKDITSSHNLVDKWFQILLQKASTGIERYL